MTKKRIVVSGINMTEGGILTILIDLLHYLDELSLKKYEIIALVNNKKNFEKVTKNIQYKEFPMSKKNWLIRLFYEYIYFYFYSKKINIDLWISMHDMTPNVNVEKLITYCHNPSPFYKMKLKNFKYDKKLYLFSKFYKFLYRINIKKNTFVIVQQEWIKKEFEKMYGISNILVNHPIINKSEVKYKNMIKEDNKIVFFYPSIPRVFKNFEIICEVAKKLEEKNIKNIEFILTINKGINKYGDFIYEKYKDIKSIKFVGKLERSEVFSYYDYSNALIFPSKLETWGLPISEFKEFNKVIFVSDLPYAKNTIGNYKKKIYFDQEDPESLLNKIVEYLNDKIKYSEEEFISLETKGWAELIYKILNKE